MLIAVASPTQELHKLQSAVHCCQTSVGDQGVRWYGGQSGSYGWLPPATQQLVDLLVYVESLGVAVMSFPR